MDALPSVDVPPGGYVVLAGQSADLPPTALVIRMGDGEIGGGLNNSGDALHLVAPNGVEADSVSFGDNKSVFDPAPPVPAAGQSLGVRDPRSDPDAANWAITDRLTPGEPNSFAAPRAKPQAAQSAVSAATPGSAPPSAAAVIVERRDSGSATLLWLVIGLLALALLGLGAAVYREPILKLFVKKP